MPPSTTAKTSTTTPPPALTTSSKSFSPPQQFYNNPPHNTNNTPHPNTKNTPTPTNTNTTTNNCGTNKSNSGIGNNNNNINFMNLKNTNKIQAKRATLVEEEDFNELTAVPLPEHTATGTPSTATTYVIAAHNNSISEEDETIANASGKVSRHLPPLKLRQSAANGTASTAQGPCATIATSARNVLQRQQASAATSPTAATSKRNTANITGEEGRNEPNEHTPLVTPLSASSATGDAVVAAAAYAATGYTAPSTSTNSSNNSINTTYYQSNVLTTTTAASTATATANATATTYSTYSHNSKTTRSWPVIYRNPHHYDYEALYAHAPKGSSQYAPASSITSSSFRQNCYSNQFKQSIVYSSSNEDLSTINECGTDGVVATNGNGGRSSSSSLIGCGGGYNNSNSKYGYQQQQQQQQQQTTCYYFSPSRHNSIYEHPSAVVANSLQFDPSSSAATTAAAAAAVESIRRSNSILLRNSSCSSKIMHQATIGGHDLDSPTSLNSAMDVTSTVGGSACCSSCCMGPPPLLFLFVTLLMTTSATAMLCAAIMTDHWEHVKWDRASLERYSNRSNLQLEWIMEDTVAMLKPDKRADHRFRRDNLFLVPMHGGIWTLCIDLPLHEIQELRRHPKFPRSAPTCLNYLAGSMENARGEEQRNDWQHSESQATLQPHLRMQNLSISCSLVCLIILGSAALVGAFGVCQRQISAILITGVMYLLAALFALFTLMIIHFKRQQGRPMLDSDYDGTVDGIVARPGGPAIMAKNLLGARVFLTSWSLDLGWGGVVLCAITSVLWILLSKIMRYNPFSTLMI
ncbi:rhoGEF domain-containing protein gxcJ isoform X1 [Stomoxys calcitrans]|uniref:rhoGEF domain-containing protein gxcJ isoform X1 n=1 Tax=Stomoxys calcitrans TaxID=35570 RepID=UPI0027E2C413|nr:rhoGEF domain-containing protein gxcJ isoform X1 [Stomoxys calcitrans]XP_013098123.2 rhoGEF domain-containing protein gxcJ isoform X1 [Stomoxys calcitrans]XP_013098124.2 rhoGEF domain-containing protein gxcJ isoform X1 [Stomoxys calcitrans]XP_013098125.2 rhoGEF domain-containing protein gxcJ isoform X1 [Stomoxys calcitrans]XP_013098128.2 rhoGEF domain-containing protein gxcJ isoform X1 [Stomoxys calcitrans]XP_059217336.1 rhoGEF domain-containing protein gxcJ isoform X1 [Stomoxys calcitrans]